MTAQTTTRTQLIRGSAKDEDSRKSRRRLLWLLILLIPVCLWLTSQIALIGLGSNRAEDTVLSSMAADYSQWSLEQFKPLKPELIGTIRSDQLTLVALPRANLFGTIVPFIPFGTGTKIAEVPTSTPTTTATRTPTSTPTPTNTPYFPAQPTRTATQTGTPLPVAITEIPTAVPPIPPTPVPVLQFDSIAYTITENGGVLTLRVILSFTSSQEITVSYSTGDGTATTPEDYAIASGTLTFAPGIAEQTVAVSILDDLADEINETLQVTLAGPANASLGVNNPAIITILDDDPCSGVSGLYTLAAVELQAVDGDVLNIACGQDIIIDLGLNRISITPGNNDFDLVFFEQIANATEMHMDWVTVQIGTSDAGPWVTVLEWGDGSLDPNTSLGQNGFTVGEPDNAPIPMAPVDPLNPQLLPAPVGSLRTGIGIDVDSAPPPPPGVYYQWLRVLSPLGGADDAAQVDYIQILP